MKHPAEVQADEVMRDGRLIGARPQFTAKLIKRAWCKQCKHACFVALKEAPKHGEGHLFFGHEVEQLCQLLKSQC